MINLLKNNLVAIAAILIVAFALLIFHAMLIPGNLLFSTDDPLGNIVQGKLHFPDAFLGFWFDTPFFGSGAKLTSLSWNSFWIYLLPAVVFKNWFHALNLVFASFFLVLFLRERGLGLPAQILGVLTAFWLGSNLTLVYASHYLKYSTMLLAACALWTIPRAIRRRSLAWSIITGSALGLMMLEQQDVAIFIGIFLGAFALYEFIRFEGLQPIPFLSRFIPMIICTLLICGPAALSSYLTIVKATNGPAADEADESPRQKWDFTTQWSWPPEESIDFIAPGYTGWRSGEPEGPYWGRMGRSAGWETSGQGFMNFKLENHYIGAISLIMVLFAIWAALARIKGGTHLIPVECPHYRAEIIFWSCAAALALLLAFGKNFPLYWLFYQLPLVSSIRNPNKFFHIFQIAMGILAAYGFDMIIRNSTLKSR